MAFSFPILYLCYVHLIRSIQSKCQYVAYNWDSVTDSDKTGAIRKYSDEFGGFAYLPPFPKLFGGALNESFATIPYPIDVCLQTDNTETTILSFKWKCSNGDLKLKIWREDYNCTDDNDGFTKSTSELFDSNELEYDCDNELEPCEYIEITEEYYSYNDSSSNNNDQDASCIIDENDKLGGAAYHGAYAVDVCIENNIGSFQYSCNSRTATYSLTQYSDTQCTSVAESKTIGNEKSIYDQGTECATDFIVDIVNFGQNLTADYDDTEDAIEFAKSTFVKCTSADEFELAFKDYCVASQVTLNDETTVMTRFGPFGVRSISEKESSRIIACDPCDLLHSCSDQWVAWDQTILFIDKMFTENITTRCEGGAKQFVFDIQSIQNLTIHGIIFESEHNVSHMIHDENDIKIPIRIMSTFDSEDPFFKSSNHTKISSLSCNYRDGYPKEVCLTVSCADFIGLNSSQTCPHVKFAGTYFIQNMSNPDVNTIYNSNPVWVKESYGGIATQYIWLDAIVNDDATRDIGSVKEFVALRWVISSQIGNATTGLYCSIVDVNEDGVDQEALSNFDVTHCEWQAISSIHNDTGSNVESAPYQCFNNLFNAPITFLCVSTYKSNETEITQYDGTYYELASDSAIYIQNKSDPPNTVVGALSLNLKYECVSEVEESDAPDQEVYNGYYAFYKKSMVPEECSPIDGEYSNLNWVLYDSSDNKIKAYCDSSELALVPTLSVKACNRWSVWDAAQDRYVLDDSFDVDIDDCTDDDDARLPQFSEYSDTLCFELNLNDSEEFIYSSVQYLWGEYTKLDLDLLFDKRPIYQNNRLNNTPFDTYLLWYDPKDAWVFITKSDLLAHHSETRSIFNSFDGIINSLDNVIVAFCDNNNDDEIMFPEECIVGWTVNGELLYGNLSLTQYTDGSLCSGVTNLQTEKTVSFDKKTKVKDLCVAFYERADDCILPKEYTNTNALNKKPLECETPSYFETSDWCNRTENEECRVLDGNGIYTQFSEPDLGFLRSYWIHENGDDGDEVFYYVYYHELLRLWVWSTDNGDEGDTAQDIESLKALGIRAYCLKWDLNVPDQCELFFYEDNDETNQTALTEVEDCTISRDESEDLVGAISAWIILSCFVCGFCVFFIGFYREYMQKRHQKKQSARVSILGDKSQKIYGQVDMMQQQLDINQTTIDEEYVEKEDMNRVVTASTAD